MIRAQGGVLVFASAIALPFVFVGAVLLDLLDIATEKGAWARYSPFRDRS